MARIKPDFAKKPSPAVILPMSPMLTAQGVEVPASGRESPFVPSPISKSSDSRLVCYLTVENIQNFFARVLQLQKLCPPSLAESKDEDSDADAEGEEEIPEEVKLPRLCASESTTGIITMHRAFDPEADEHRELPMTPGSNGGSKRTLADSVHLIRTQDLLKANKKAQSRPRKMSLFSAQNFTECSSDWEKLVSAAKQETPGDGAQGKGSKSSTRDSDLEGQSAAGKAVGQLRKALMDAT